MDQKAPHALNWHFLPWNLELRGPHGVRPGEADIMHQGELPAGTQLAIRGTLRTYLYVIHIDSTNNKITQLYPRQGHEEQDSGLDLRLPLEPEEMFTLPGPGVVRVVVSQQQIQPADWDGFAQVGGRAPPPMPVRR
jgi:hypothetical protein